MAGGSVGTLVVAIGDRPIGRFGLSTSIGEYVSAGVTIGCVRSGTFFDPFFGRDDTYTYDVMACLTIFNHSRRKCRHATACEPTGASFLPPHEGERESDNKHLRGALDPVADSDQNFNRGDVYSPKK